MSWPYEWSRFGLVARLFMAAVAVSQIIDLILSWTENSVSLRILDVVAVGTLTLVILDAIQRKAEVTRDALRIRYLFRWKTYPLPDTTEIQDWGHSVGFVDRVTSRPLFVLSKSTLGGTRAVQELHAEHEKGLS